MIDKLKILWVDDDINSIDHWKKPLDIFGFQITAASNINDALFELGSSSFDLILVDLDLGEELSGIDLVSSIREKDDLTPVFILSAYTKDTRYSEKIDKLKLNGILEKPFPADKKSLEEILLRMELSCQEADLIKLQSKYKNIHISEYLKKKSIGKICFVLMPFKDELNLIYEEHIKKVLSKKHILVKRADEIYGVTPIINDIQDAIKDADFLIADLTGKNPNVFYELGLSHAINKPVILISQSIDDVPFDLKHRRCIIYSDTYRGILSFEEILSKTINSVIEALL